MTIGKASHIEDGNVALVYIHWTVVVLHRESIISCEEECFDDCVKVKLRDERKRFNGMMHQTNIAY